MANPAFPLAEAIYARSPYSAPEAGGIYRPRGDFWNEVGTMENMTVRGVAKVLGTGAFASGQEAYNEGVGFYLEANNGNPRFSLGDSAGDNMTWDGSQLAISGALTATSGAIGGWNVNPTDLSGGNAVLRSAGQLELGTINDIVVMDATDPTYRLWVGNAVGGLSPFRVDKAGQATMTNINVTGGVVAGSVVGSGIQGGNINTGTIDTNQLAAGAVEAGNINVVNLAAIKADLGTITAGTINAAQINVQNLSFGHMEQTGTLGADQNFGVNDLVINSTGQLRFGAGGNDYISDNLIHFEVASEQALIEFRNGSGETAQIKGFATSTSSGVSLNASGTSSRFAVVSTSATSSDGTTNAQIAAIPGSGGQTSISVTSTGVIGLTGLGTAYASWNSSRHLTLFGRLYPGPTSGSQSSRYIYDANSRITLVGEVDIASVIHYGQIATTGGSGGIDVTGSGDAMPSADARMAIKDGAGTTWWVPLYSAVAPWAA